MRTAQRRIDAGVVEQLLDQPYRFGFFQAVRVLEQWFMRQGGAHAGERAARRITFRTTLSLAFPPSEIQTAVSYNHAGEPLKERAQRAAALEAGTFGKVDISAAFFGLLGGHGALPRHYTELIAAQEQRHRDLAAREFLDVFSDRTTALFYDAWKKYRLPLQYETERKARYLPALLALAGVGDRAGDALRNGAGMPDDEAIAGYAAAARHRPVSAAYLSRTLSDYFGVAVGVEQFAGKWYDVPEAQLTSLAQFNVFLGANALVGERVWQRDMRVRLVIGPLTKKDYTAFLPGAARARALARMLAVLADVSLEYEVSLVLRRDEIGPICLSEGAYLGWDAFLCTGAAERDRDDARYDIHTTPSR